MPDAVQQTAEMQKASAGRYYHDPLWRLLAELPWLGIALVLVAVLSIRIVLAMGGAFRFDRLTDFLVPNLLILGSLFVPMVFLIASGDADLSSGLLAGVVGWIVAILSPKVGLGAAIAASLLIALGVGLINGLLVGLAKMKGIVVTFAVGFLLSGLILLLSGGKTMRAPMELGPDLARSPLLILFWLLWVVGCAALMKFTSLGSRPCAEDRVVETLRARLFYRGLPFVVSGFASWISGILFLSYIGNATLASGSGFVETVLLATALGGTAYFSGTGFFLSGAVALIAIILLQYGNQLANVPSADQRVVLGVLLIVMLAVAHVYHRIVDGLHRRRRKPV